MIVKIEGTVALIRKATTITTGFLVEFIIVQKNENYQNHFLVWAVSRDEQVDKYRIESLLDQQVAAECYLNGRKSEGQKGTYYANNLVVKTIQTTW